MKILELYRDYNIPHQTSGHKHCRDGWVNTVCPFCTGNAGLHLGASLNGEVFTCWRCGWKPPDKAIAGLVGISKSKAQSVIKEYGGKSRAVENQVKQAPRLKAHKLPSDVGGMEVRHKKYLASRGFNPNKLERKWKLKATGPISRLDGIDYSHRILAPIYWEGGRVSFQTRDITSMHDAKYMGCPEKRELTPHKDILYGKQSLWGERGICVEGITDVWRLGTSSFATFGIKYTQNQVRAMATNFKHVTILFDDDPQAVKQANKLQSALSIRGVQSKVEIISGDPGGLTSKQAKNLVQKIY
jgi:hypothetical protein